MVFARVATSEVVGGGARPRDAPALRWATALWAAEVVQEATQSAGM